MFNSQLVADSDFGPDGTDTVQEQTFRPGTEFENYKLTCGIIGNPPPTFTWTSTKSGVEINASTGRVLELNNKERVDGEKEDITCTGTVDYGGEGTLLWRSYYVLQHKNTLFVLFVVHDPAKISSQTAIYPYNIEHLGVESSNALGCRSARPEQSYVNILLRSWEGQHNFQLISLIDSHSTNFCW